MSISIRNYLWLVLLLVGLTLTGFYVRASESTGLLLYYTAAGLSLSAALGALWLHRPTYKLPWFALIGGIATLLAADLTWDNYETLFGREPGNPSYADPLYIAGFGAAIIAFLLWSKRVNFGNNREDGIDAGIVSIGMAVVAWMFILEPRLGNTYLSLSGQLLSVTYPVLDLFLLTLMVRIVMRRGLSSHRALGLFMLGTLAFGMSDVLWGWGELTSNYAALAMVADSGWMLCYVFWGAAALDPSVVALERTVHAEKRTGAYLSTARATLLVGTALVVPVTLILRQVQQLSLDMLVIAIGATLLFTLVVSRMQLIVRSLESAMETQTELQDGLAFAAFHDPLTGLANRALINVSLEDEVAKHREGSMALLFLDLDNFKDINDQRGHAAGDRLLIQVAEQLQSCIRPQDMIGRIGGDEFVILLRFRSESPLDTSIAVSERILDSFREPMLIDGHRVQIGASIGIAWLGTDHVSVDGILRAADHAMYDAKRAGKNRYSVAPITADADGVGAAAGGNASGGRVSAAAPVATYTLEAVNFPSGA